MPAPGRPWITANQVTLARLIPMPLLSWLIYRGASEGFQDNVYMWSALIAGTLIGCTDWVDGMLARRYGPTVLGGLLDPIADKVFIAFAYVPFADDALGMVPAWACALMFTRELFITALRSAYEQRDLTLKTSYFAKVKTWTQMQGIGVMLLFPLLGPNSKVLTYLLVFGIVTPLIVMVVWWILKRKLWRGALVMGVAIGPILALHLHGDQHLTLRVLMIAVVALTWASGIDYILIGWKQLRGRGDFARADAVRLVGALALPGLLFAVLVETPAPAWPVFAIPAPELAGGRLDNPLSHPKPSHKAPSRRRPLLGVCSLLALAIVIPAQATLFSYAASAVSLIGVTIEFWLGRDYYMDKRIRDRAARSAAASGSQPAA